MMQCHVPHMSGALAGIRPISNQEPTVLSVGYIRSKEEYYLILLFQKHILGQHELSFESDLCLNLLYKKTVEK